MVKREVFIHEDGVDRLEVFMRAHFTLHTRGCRSSSSSAEIEIELVELIVLMELVELEIELIIFGNAFVFSLQLFEFSKMTPQTIYILKAGINLLPIRLFFPA